jgi:hypothetical protein
MTRVQSLRLAQFWQTRLQSLIAFTDNDSPLFASAVYEAVGWLIEGGFCGCFDLREADVVWTRLRPTVRVANSLMNV